MAVYLNYRVRATETNTVAERIVNLFDNDAALQTETSLAKIIENIKACSEKLVVAIHRDRVFSDLEDADLLRDDKVKAIANIIHGAIATPIPDVQKAGILLINIFDKYGISITRDNYMAESTLIESMLNDFAIAEVAATVEKINGLSIALNDLKEAQNSFETASAAYKAHLVSQANSENATKLKKTMRELINNNLMKYLDVMKDISTGIYTNFLKGVNKEIEDANELVRYHAPKVTIDPAATVSSEAGA